MDFPWPYCNLEGVALLMDLVECIDMDLAAPPIANDEVEVEDLNDDTLVILFRWFVNGDGASSSSLKLGCQATENNVYIYFFTCHSIQVLSSIQDPLSTAFRPDDEPDDVPCLARP